MVAGHRGYVHSMAARASNETSRGTIDLAFIVSTVVRLDGKGQ
jgi:hypothetical protein